MSAKDQSIWYIHPYAGGPGIGRHDRPYHLARHWAHAGHASVILTPTNHHLMDAPRSIGAEVVIGVNYDFLKAPPYEGNGLGRLVNMAAFSVQLLRQGEELARRHGTPKAVIASSPHPYAFLTAQRIAKRFGVPCIFEVRDIWPLSLVELAGVSSSHPLVVATGWLERYAYRTADAVVSLLPASRDYMVSRGLMAERWHYIPNGVEPDDEDLSGTAPTPCASLARTWRQEGRPVAIYAGAFGRPNHVESLVEAIRLIRDAGGTASAIIVGRGETGAELRDQVQRGGLQDRVAIFDQIPKKSVLALLREVSMGYISLRPEPLFRFGVSPNKLFDYMLAALPVVFAVRAGNDPVSDAGCGVSTDAGNPAAIAEAITRIGGLDEEARMQMGKRGREYVKTHHGYDQLATAYLKAAGIQA